MIAVIDTGAVGALVPIDEDGRARLRALRRRTDHLEVSAAVLAEGLLSGHPGRDHHMRRLLGLLRVTAVDEQLGLAAGSLRFQALHNGARPAPSGVDALVVALADRRAAADEVVIYTTDRHDIEILSIYARHRAVISVSRG